MINCTINTDVGTMEVKSHGKMLFVTFKGITRMLIMGDPISRFQGFFDVLWQCTVADNLTAVNMNSGKWKSKNGSIKHGVENVVKECDRLGLWN